MAKIGAVKTRPVSTSKPAKISKTVGKSKGHPVQKHSNKGNSIANKSHSVKTQQRRVQNQKSKNLLQSFINGAKDLGPSPSFRSVRVAPFGKVRYLPKRWTRPDLVKKGVKVGKRADDGVKEAATKVGKGIKKGIEMSSKVAHKAVNQAEQIAKKAIPSPISKPAGTKVSKKAGDSKGHPVQKHSNKGNSIANKSHLVKTQKNLGTDKLKVYREINGEKVPVPIDSHKINGDPSRKFKLHERLVGLVGKSGNWWGPDRSGGKKIYPGGIGDVSVPPKNKWDSFAKHHDIERWLAATFKKGDVVFIEGVRKKGELTKYVVKTESEADRDVITKVAKEVRKDLVKKGIKVVENTANRIRPHLSTLWKTGKGIYDGVYKPAKDLITKGVIKLNKHIRNGKLYYGVTGKRGAFVPGLRYGAGKAASRIHFSPSLAKSATQAALKNALTLKTLTKGAFFSVAGRALDYVSKGKNILSNWTAVSSQLFPE
ncbi:MAG: hypothetical protein QME81_13620 [bacterium]|nr:hypothetical protein [bacterium]